jgi:ribosomal protein L11 methyltransferase
VADLLERRLGQPPSIYSNDEQWMAVVSAYLYAPSLRLRALKASLRTDLRRIAGFGLDVEPGIITVRRVPTRDWAESWKRHFKPLEVGDSLLIQPTWSRRKPRAGQQVVLLDPGLSFGTGHHATTRFCLEQVAALRRPGQPQSFLDMGTGTGILAIAAARLGYASVRAFDFDPDCVRIARENAALNGVPEQVRPERADLMRLPPRSSERFDVVCANLMYDLLLAGRGRILGRLKPGGTLVLAGILATQFSLVADAYTATGLRLVASRTEKEWRSGAFRRL